MFHKFTSKENAKKAFLLLFAITYLHGCHTVGLADEWGPATIPFGLAFDAMTPYMKIKKHYDQKKLERYRFQYNGWKMKLQTCDFFYVRRIQNV